VNKLAKKEKNPFKWSFKESVKGWLGITQAVATEVQPVNESAKKAVGQSLREFWLWYTANSSRLNDFYCTMKTTNSKKDYFWAVTGYENNKKTHTGLPKAIVDTLCNISGVPIITINQEENADETTKKKYEEIEARLQEIINFNDFTNIVKQDARTKTLVIGGGVFIVSDLRSTEASLDKPIIEFVDEREVDILTIGNIFVGCERRIDFTDGTCDYILYEKRTYNQIENRLFNKSHNAWVSLQSLEDTAHLEPVQVLTIDAIPAVAMRYKNGHRGYGLSIYEGKLDLFDDLDQTYSQIAELVRKSTPVTYIDSSFIEMVNKKAVDLNTYDRKYQIVRAGGNQQEQRTIKTEQPALNYAGLIDVATNQLIQALTGIISPASLGYEIQRQNNAEAMREKEKVTLITRDDIIDNERGVIERVLKLAMTVYDAMLGKKTMEYDIAVDYSDFSSPTFDQVVATLLPLWSADAISPKQFAAMLHTDTLTDQELAEEIAYLEGAKKPALDMSNLFGEDEDGTEKELNGGDDDAVQQ
jgi:hypothetical protein